MEFLIPFTRISLPVPLKVKQPQNIFFGGVLALAQYDNLGGVLPYFFVLIETDILELQNDFRQRIYPVFIVVDPIFYVFCPLQPFLFHNCC